MVCLPCVDSTRGYSVLGFEFAASPWRARPHLHPLPPGEDLQWVCDRRSRCRLTRQAHDVFRNQTASKGNCLTNPSAPSTSGKMGPCRTGQGYMPQIQFSKNTLWCSTVRILAQTSRSGKPPRPPCPPCPTFVEKSSPRRGSRPDWRPDAEEGVFYGNSRWFCLDERGIRAVRRHPEFLLCVSKLV